VLKPPFGVVVGATTLGTEFIKNVQRIWCFKRTANLIVSLTQNKKKEDQTTTKKKKDDTVQPKK